MNEHIRHYSEELLSEFFDFLVDYQGNLCGEWISDTELNAVTHNGTRIFMDGFLRSNLIEIFLTARDKKIE